MPSILPYLDSINWLSFYAVSHGCYQIVHGTLDFWQSSDVTSLAADADASANGGESEALWILALERVYQFNGKVGDKFLQSIHSLARCKDILWKDDNDIVPFLVVRER
jgi:hypothetical protein